MKYILASELDDLFNDDDFDIVPEDNNNEDDFFEFEGSFFRLNDQVFIITEQTKEKDSSIVNDSRYFEIDTHNTYTDKDLSIFITNLFKNIECHFIEIIDKESNKIILNENLDECDFCDEERTVHSFVTTYATEYTYHLKENSKEYFIGISYLLNKYDKHKVIVRIY